MYILPFGLEHDAQGNHGSLLAGTSSTKGFGKRLIKTFKVSPDAYVQLALQLANYRDQVFIQAKIWIFWKIFLGKFLSNIRSLNDSSFPRRSNWNCPQLYDWNVRIRRSNGSWRKYFFNHSPLNKHTQLDFWGGWFFFAKDSRTRFRNRRKNFASSSSKQLVITWNFIKQQWLARVLTDIYSHFMLYQDILVSNQSFWIKHLHNNGNFQPRR